MKISKLVRRVNLHLGTALAARHLVEALTDRLTMRPVMLTGVGFVGVAVTVAGTAYLLEVPVSRVLVARISIGLQVPVAMTLTGRALMDQVPLEIGLELRQVEEGIGVSMVHVVGHVSSLFHIMRLLYFNYENKYTGSRSVYKDPTQARCRH